MEIKNRVPGSRDPVQQANRLRRKFVLSQNPEEKKELQKQINAIKKEYDLVHPITFGERDHFTTRETAKRYDKERKKKAHSDYKKRYLKSKK